MSFALRFQALCVLVLVLPAPVLAQDSNKPVYRCPGPPVLYTDALTSVEARERQCRTIEGALVTIVQGRAPAARLAPGASGAVTAPISAPVSGPGSGPVSGGSAARPVDRIDPAAQRARDTDARRILGDELRREEERLTMLQKDYNNGQPERRGDERNFQKYIDRVADLKAGIQRKEADITALRREIAKLPQ